MQIPGLAAIAAGAVLGIVLGALAFRGAPAATGAELGATTDRASPSVSHPRVPQPPAPMPPVGEPQHAPAAYAAQPMQPSYATACLYCFDGPDRGRQWPLALGAVTIGRGPHNTIVLADPGVSTTHAQIGFDGQQFVLTDLQSRNGCYVNNQRVQRAPLRDRDVVVVGTTYLAVALNGAPG
jgi:hypothetical protein